MRPLLLLAALSALVLDSCFPPGDGQAPPLDKLYFPTGVALDVVPDGSATPAPYLYVASSDFDLQYRSSSLASFDLDVLGDVLPRSCVTDADCNCPTNEDCSSIGTTCDNKATTTNPAPSFFCYAKASGEPAPCGTFTEHTNAEKLLYPGRCGYIESTFQYKGKPLLKDAVGIGAFATDVIARTENADGTGSERLFLPVRGDATLHWIDLDDGQFSCGQSDTDDQSCDAAHRAGNTQYTDTNDLIQPSEPFAIAATADADYVAVTNQTTGSVSLFSNKWIAEDAVKLQDVIAGLPSAPVAIASVPQLGLPTDTGLAPAFLVAYENAARIDLLRVQEGAQDSDAQGEYPHDLLTFAGSASINANSLGYDSRGIVIDDAQRQQDYDACATAAKCTRRPTDDCIASAAYQACAQQVHQPSVYVANRAPSSLLVGGMTPDYSYAAGSSELPAFIDSVALTSGPSRLVLGRVKVPAIAARLPHAGNDYGGDFDLEQRVFVVCFDSRRIFVYDPKRRAIEAIIDTGRGPYALAIDEQRGFGYVAHFTDSYLGVISLDQRFPQNYASIVASIGAPTPPRASK